MLLHFSTWDPLITLLALCILWMIPAHGRALAGPPPSYEKYVGGKKTRRSGKPFGNSQVCLEDRCLLRAVNLNT